MQLFLKCVAVGGMLVILFTFSACEKARTYEKIDTPAAATETPAQVLTEADSTAPVTEPETTTEKPNETTTARRRTNRNPSGANAAQGNAGNGAQTNTQGNSGNSGNAGNAGNGGGSTPQTPPVTATQPSVQTEPQPEPPTASEPTPEPPTNADDEPQTPPTSEGV